LGFRAILVLVVEPLIFVNTFRVFLTPE